MENRLIGLSGKKQHGKNTVANIIAYLTGPNTHYPFINNDSWFTSNGKWIQKSFAYKLKKIASLLLGKPISDFEDEQEKNKLLSKEWDIVTDKTEEVLSVRGFLQKLGTEVGRSLHPNLWINALFSDYVPMRRKYMRDDVEEYSDEHPYWIITDVRFPNEVESIKHRGGLVLRVFRPGQLRVWYNDSNYFDEEGFSGIYYVQAIEDNIYMLTKYADGTGLSVSAVIDELTFEPQDSHQSELALDDYNFDEIIINDGNIEMLIEKVKQVLVKHKIL